MLSATTHEALPNKAPERILFQRQVGPISTPQARLAPMSQVLRFLIGLGLGAVMTRTRRIAVNTVEVENTL